MGILNVATYVTVDGQYVNVLEMNQYQNKIRFLQLTGTSGTLTSQQINLLRSDNTNYIIVDNELYNCNDLQDTNGYLVYTHTGADASNNVNIKTLSITLTNNNWSIQTTPVQPKIPVANTNEAVQFAEDERQKSKNLFDLNTMVIYNQGASINKTAGSDIEFYYSSTTAVVKIPVLPNKTYFLSSNNIQFYIGETQSNGTTQTGNPDNNLDWSTNTIITTTDNTYFIVAVVRYIGAEIVITKDVFQNSNTQLEYGNKQTSYQPYNGEIVHEKEIEITTGNATLNTDVVTAGEVSWVKQGKLVVVSFSDLKFKGAVAHNNLYFSGLPKKAIKSQTFLLHQMNAGGGSSIRCMMQMNSTQIVNWYQDTTLDTNAQYYGQLTYITE